MRSCGCMFLSILLVATGTMMYFNPSAHSKEISLPPPEVKGKLSLEDLLNTRRSVRSFSSCPLTLEEVSALLWAAYGKNQWGRKTSPSAGALYPLVIYIVAGNVQNLEQGVYGYDSPRHRLCNVLNKDVRRQLAHAALSQTFIQEAGVVFVITARYEVTTSKYGKRGVRYVHIEAGHVGQNIYLEATNLGLGTVAVGAFDDQKVKEVLGIEEEPLYIMPVGKP